MSQGLPSLNKAYALLCQTGRQYPDAAEHLSPLGDLTYTHRRRGQESIAVQDRVIRAIGCIYAKDAVLRSKLEEHGAHTAHSSQAIRFVERQMQSDGLILGFSGYASPHEDGYGVEEKGLQALYAYLSHIKRLPKLAVDGAAADGFLGLSGAAAQSHKVTSLGVTPRQGLGSMAPREHMIVKGQVYADREDLIGVLPDILVCVGGGKGTQNEYETALRHGGSVLMLTHKTYPADSLAQYYEKLAVTQPALTSGRLVVSRSVKDIPKSVQDILQGITANPDSRPARLRIAKRLLATA